MRYFLLIGPLVLITACSTLLPQDPARNTALNDKLQHVEDTLRTALPIANRWVPAPYSGIIEGAGVLGLAVLAAWQRKLGQRLTEHEQNCPPNLAKP